MRQCHCVQPSVQRSAQTHQICRPPAPACHPATLQLTKDSPQWQHGSIAGRLEKVGPVWVRLYLSQIESLHFDAILVSKLQLLLGTRLHSIDWQQLRFISIYYATQGDQRPFHAIQDCRSRPHRLRQIRPLGRVQPLDEMSCMEGREVYGYVGGWEGGTSACQSCHTSLPSPPRAFLRCFLV